MGDNESKNWVSVNRKGIEELRVELEFLQNSVLLELKSTIEASKSSVDMVSEIKSVQSRMADLTEKIALKEELSVKILKQLQDSTSQQFMEELEENLANQRKKIKEALLKTENSISKMEEDFREEFFAGKRNSNRLFEVLREATSNNFDKLSSAMGMVDVELKSIRTKLIESNELVESKNILIEKTNLKISQILSEEEKKLLEKKIKRKYFLTIIIPYLILGWTFFFYAFWFGLIKPPIIETESYYHINKEDWVKTTVENRIIYQFVVPKKD